MMHGVIMAGVGGVGVKVFCRGGGRGGATAVVSAMVSGGVVGDGREGVLLV